MEETYLDRKGIESQGYRNVIDLNGRQTYDRGNYAGENYIWLKYDCNTYELIIETINNNEHRWFNRDAANLEQRYRGQCKTFNEFIQITKWLEIPPTIPFDTSTAIHGRTFLGRDDMSG